jgi:hypothetical protein
MSASGPTSRGEGNEGGVAGEAAEVGVDVRVEASGESTGPC